MLPKTPAEAVDCSCRVVFGYPKHAPVDVQPKRSCQIIDDHCLITCEQQPPFQGLGVSELEYETAASHANTGIGTPDKVHASDVEKLRGQLYVGTWGWAREGGRGAELMQMPLFAGQGALRRRGVGKGGTRDRSSRDRS